ncbi:Glycosyltransferase involved in cell wall bisynthesis [Lachnospiraceae bacterium RM5]|nr:Glycosyltransferase involved in cell wall bisynthesis [Lachnospiraceae bacterium RM5]
MKSVEIIVPCYNEEEGIDIFYEETKKITDSIKDYSFKFIFIDDGSKDKTLEKLMNLANNRDVYYISFSRNFGKEAGMYAGLKNSSADYVIIMDADLQHPPKLIIDMINGIEEGYDCVAARRVDRKGESPVRNAFSKMFYRLSNKITDVKLERGVVDYRIMSRQMVDAVLSLSESQRFSKGIFEWVGFKKKWIPYENVERTIGSSKWSFWSLFKYAVDGITAFSLAPLKLVTLCGFLISFFAFIYIIATLIQTCIYGIVVPGYVTTLSAVLFLGGIIEFSIGLLGAYLGHIYVEAKDRPLYITKYTNIDNINSNGFDVQKGIKNGKDA